MEAKATGAVLVLARSISVVLDRASKSNLSAGENADHADA